MKTDAPVAVSLDSIQRKIESVSYYLLPGTRTTVCHLHLKNGFVLIGSSHCLNPELFDEGIGRDEAFKDARSQLWTLEGYLFAEQRYQQQLTDAPAQNESFRLKPADSEGGASD